MQCGRICFNFFNTLFCFTADSFKTGHKLTVLVMIALFVFFLAASTGAYEVRSGGMTVIPEGKIQGPLFCMAIGAVFLAVSRSRSAPAE